jgi:hypothetical protein
MDENPDIDVLVKGMLEPETQTVSRVISSAMQIAQRRRKRTGRIIRCALLAGGVAICAILLAVFLSRPRVRVDYISVESIGNVTVLRSTSGEIWIFGSKPGNRIPEPAIQGGGKK